MKILYVANERRSAQLAVIPLRDVAPGVRLAWAGSLAGAFAWAHDNRDLGALIVESEVGNQSTAPFIGRVRTLGVTAPVVVVAPEQGGAPVAALHAGADDYVVNNQSLLADLPGVLTAAIRRTQAAVATAPVRLLYVGDASLARQCLAHGASSIDIIEAAPGPGGTVSSIPSAIPATGSSRPFDVLLIEQDHPGVDAFAILKRFATRQPQLPVILVTPWDDRLVIPALRLGATDCILKTPEAFRTLFFKLNHGRHPAYGGAKEVRDQVPVAPAARDTDRERLEQQLRDALGRGRETEQRLNAAAQQLRDSETRFRAAIDRDRVERETLEAKLEVAEEARREVERTLDADRKLSAALAAGRQAEHDAALAHAATTRVSLERRVTDAEARIREAEERHASETTAAAERLAQREAEFTASLAESTRSRDALAQAVENGAEKQNVLERQLLDAEATREDTEQRHASELKAAAAHVAERQARHDEELSRAAAARDAITRELRDTAHRLEQARRDLAAETGAVERLTTREAELTASLADTTATVNTLERQLTDARDALNEAERRASAERQSAADRETQLEGDLAREVAARGDVEQRLSNADAARRDAEALRASEAARAEADLAERQARHDAELAHAAQSRDRLVQELRDTSALLDETRRDLAVEAAAVERLTQREAELSTTLAESTAIVNTLERLLADARDALREAEQRTVAERRAAAERHTQIEADLAQKVAAHTVLEQRLTSTERAREEAAQRHASELAAAAEQLTRREAELGTVLADTSAALAALEERVAQEVAARQQLERELVETRLSAEADLQRLSAEHADHLRQTLEHLSNVHALERSMLENLVTERDAQLTEQAASHLAAQQTAASALAEIEDRLRVAVETSSHEITELRREVEALTSELKATKGDRDALRKEADRLPQLRSELEQREAENRRRFISAPYGICECRRDGRLGRFNRALVRLLGYRTADELRQVDFATRVFESGDDLRSLIERCLTSRRTESIETKWRRKDSRRLIVRVLAVPIGEESVEFMAEDITDLRAAENRLRQAHRMEAVGRLASEVATTCDHLLRDVSHDCQRWLAAAGSDATLRYQGELLLSDVTRAATVLQQLATYSKQQASAVEPVCVNRVLRDMAPVLERVAGGDVEFVLPKTSTQITADVAAERLERVLINVAGYARQRMPFGGQLKIDLASVVVDPQFVAKYPSVRPGEHALITVSEVKGTDHSVAPIDLRSDAGEDARRSASSKPSVDFGALSGLVRNSGGHLWMTAEPDGNMVLKIHLPRPASDDPTEATVPVERSERRLSLARLFGH